MANKSTLAKSLRNKARAIQRYFLAVHLNPTLTFRSFIGIIRYFRDRKLFGELSTESFWSLNSYPILHDWNAESANLGEYFWQDLFVAKNIITQNPDRHVDVGSRVDGFIAHLACVREVEVFDIRPLSAKIENVSFTQWDLLSPREELDGVSDCVSCLHTLEHIGLGRYGDPVDPEGWKKGISSLARLIRKGGGFGYLFL